MSLFPTHFFSAGFRPLPSTRKFRSQNKPTLKHRAILLCFLKHIVKTVDDINLSFENLEIVP
ncbi:hypothetical protein ACQP3J_31025, partial [Escherichia coli]